MKQFYKHKTLNLFYYEDINDGDEIILRNFLGDFTTTLTFKELVEGYEVVDETTNIYLNLLDKYKDKQMIKATEELAELTQAIDKMMIEENEKHKDKIIEETADVEIMLEQVKLYYDIDQNAVESQKQAKIKRTIERLLK